MDTSPRVRFCRYGLFLAFLAVAGALWLDDPHHASRREAALACARANLEAMWGVKLLEGVEIMGSERQSQVASAGWDLNALGCSGAIHASVTVDEIFGAKPSVDVSYTAAIP